MSERLWKGDLSGEQLAQWLAPPRTAAGFAILERLDGVDFPAKEEAIALTKWQKGRVFGEAYELRWERRGERYRVWLAGKHDGAGLEPLNTLDSATMEPNRRCYLWGPDEQRIARRIAYRSLRDGQGRPQLVRHDFWSKGTLVYSRFVRLQWEAQP